MKKQSIISMFSVLMLLTWNNVHAQEPPPQKKTRVGVAVAITDIRDLFQFIEGDGPSAPKIFIPINLSRTLRIEPEIGFFQSSSEREDYKSSRSGVSFGLGVFRMALKDAMNLYYGARLGLTRTSSSSEFSRFNGSDTHEESGEGFFVAPTVGGEYFLSDKFALGGEGQLRYTSSSAKDGDNEDSSFSTTSTRVLLFIRFYF